MAECVFKVNCLFTRAFSVFGAAFHYVCYLPVDQIIIVYRINVLTDKVAIN